MEKLMIVALMMLVFGWSPEAVASEAAGELEETSVSATGYGSNKGIDLRNRNYFGVQYYTGARVSGREWEALTLEGGLVLENIVPQTGVRREERMFVGSISPMKRQADLLIYGMDRGGVLPLLLPRADEAQGSIQRQLPVAVGGGFSVFRFHYREIHDSGGWDGGSRSSNVMLFDIGTLHLNWEILRSASEDFLVLSTRVGGTLPTNLDHDDNEIEDLALFPEVALRASFSPDSLGRTEISFEGSFRKAWMVSSGESWLYGHAAASLEQVVFAFGELPISVFASPQIRYYDIPRLGLVGTEILGLVGVRVTMQDSTRVSLLD